MMSLLRRLIRLLLMGLGSRISEFEEELKSCGMDVLTRNACSYIQDFCPNDPVGHIGEAYGKLGDLQCTQS